MNDPTGHCGGVCIALVLVATAFILTGSVNREEYGNTDQISASPTIDLDQAIDNALWTIPSAYGVKINGGGQAGFIAEGGGSAGIGLVANWRSMQLSVFTEGNAQAYIGTPQILSKELSLSLFTVKGASRNENLAGISDYIGATVSTDGFGEIGFSTTESIGKTQNGKDIYIDPVSQRPIQTNTISVFGGGNLAANGFDAGLIFGRSYTSLIKTFTNKKQLME